MRCGKKANWFAGFVAVGWHRKRPPIQIRGEFIHSWISRTSKVIRFPDSTLLGGDIKPGGHSGQSFPVTTGTPVGRCTSRSIFRPTATILFGLNDKTGWSADMETGSGATHDSSLSANNVFTSIFRINLTCLAVSMTRGYLCRVGRFPVPTDRPA
jgi:hypothetical protein